MQKWTRLLGLLFLPPLLPFGLAVLQDALRIARRGLCEGWMDAPDYPCTVGQYLGQWVLSPFGAAIFAAYLIPWALLLALLYPAVLWARQAWRRYSRPGALEG
ncbi:hypothetical protein [Calidithermus chliarophilus]|uniref:hypothetical protein n=1 Tax=Calidithermus chliarophilus TaxID=52023 RepID=UPI000401430F|nr:hypothetical protein [Calidithermus chliarophilus]